MEVKQVYEITNTITAEYLGDSVVVAEDLSNVVEVGKAFANLDNGYDNYVRSLFDHIGRVVFVNRAYRGRVPSVVRDAWEFGAILEKISMKLPDAEENETWSLEAGASVDPNIFYAPTVSAKFWNKRVTFEIPMSITERQVKSAFSNATQLNAFYSMIQTYIENSITVKTDSLVMRAINGLMADTLYAEYTGGVYTGGSGVRAVNLLYLYNNGPNYGGSALTAAKALTTPEFIRFAAMTMANYMDRMSVMSTLFNIDGAERFTPKELLHVVMLSDFKNAAGAYLQSDTFHEQYTALPEAETVPFWQGSGTDYAFSSVSKIYETNTPGGHSVECSGILACMFDRDALGVANLDRRTTNNYNAKGEFWNEFHKADMGLWNDPAENMVVFFVA